MTENKEEKQTESKEKIKNNIAKFHDKHYKKLLLIPAIILILSLVYMVSFYNINGDYIYRDISLTGGTSVTIYDNLDANILKQNLGDRLDDISTRMIYDLVTREKQALIVETKSDGELTKQVLEDYLGYELTEENSSFEFTSSIFSENFYRQLLVAILIAFVFMAIVVFIIFRKFAPSIAVIISAFADILMTLVFVNLLSIKMSLGGIIAFLMLIGYSVDTDILLTNRTLKRKNGSLNSRIFGALKTGITMTLTSLIAMLVALILVSSFSIVLSQIFLILVVGLVFDILNTWITNVSILKWYIKLKK